MKFLKITWYSLIVIFLFAGLFTGAREFFLLFFIMLFVVFYVLALNLWTAFSFSFIQELSDKAVVKGSAPNLKIGIYNDKPFPFTLMKIHVDVVTTDNIYELNFNLSPRSNIDYVIPLQCPYRGIYRVGMTYIEFYDIFGLVKMRFDMRRLSYYRQQMIKIFPLIVELPFLPVYGSDAKYSGGMAKSLSEDGDSYSDLRQYRPGDSLKRVHKPISAKRRELYVKNYDIPLESVILVAIDTAMDTGVGESARYLSDIACQCVVAITAISLQSGFNVELVGADSPRPLRREAKRETLPALCDTLAKLPFDKTGDISATLEIAASKTEGLRAAYIVSTSGPTAFAGTLHRLQREGCHVCCIRVSLTKDRLDSDDSIPGVTCIPVTPWDDIRSVMTEGKV